MTDRKVYEKIVTYEQAFGLVLGLSFDCKLQNFVAGLEKEGHVEKSIAYSIWRTQDILKQYTNNHKYNNEFIGVLKKEILKFSWAKDDPRWDIYWKKRNEEEKAKKYADDLKKKYIRKEDVKKEEIKLPKKPNSYKGYVYFVQGMSGGAIKIGYSTDPELRLKNLQTSYPDTLKILCLIPGNEKREKSYHDRFYKYRLNGEWFTPDKFILDVIEQLKVKYNQVGD